MRTILLALGLLSAKPPPMPSHLAPRLVEFGLGTETIKAAWEAVFWIGWGGGFIVGGILVAVILTMLAVVILAMACLLTALSNRSHRNATDAYFASALPSPGAWTDPRRAR
jgi:Flp pilus assembly protein TadB